MTDDSVPVPDPQGDDRVEVGASRDFAGMSARAGAVTLVAQGVLFALGVGSTMILARLLGPDDFGVVAMVLTLVAFVGVFNDFGLPAAAVHRASLAPSQATTLFWIGTGLSLAVCAASLAITPALGAFYKEPRLIRVVPLMSIVFLAVGMGALPQGLLRRDMRFGVLTLAEVSATACGYVVAITLALLGAGYWALATQYPVTAVVRTILLWRSCGWRPSRPSPVREVWGMISYGKDVTLYRMVNHLGKHLDRVLIGYFSGAGTLGLYAAADRWAMYPVQQVYPPLLNVAVSGLTRVRDDVERYRRYFRRAYEPLLTAILPVLTLLFVASNAFVMTMLGPQWTSAVPLLRILLVGAFATAISQFTKWVYLVEGRTRTQLRWGLLGSAATAGAVAVAAPHGAAAVALAFSGSMWVLAGPAIARCLAGSPLTIGDIVCSAWRPAFASLAAAAMMMIVGPFGSAFGPLVELTSDAVIFTALYVGLWLATPGGPRSAAAMLAMVVRLRRDRRDVKDSVAVAP